MAKKQTHTTNANQWLIMNEYDANDSFYVTADGQAQAIFEALQELGWTVSAEPVEDEE